MNESILSIKLFEYVLNNILFHVPSVIGLDRYGALGTTRLDPMMLKIFIQS